MTDAWFVPLPVDPPGEPPVRLRQPVWAGPPDDELPGVVPVELVLGLSDQAAVLLTGIEAFSTGLFMNLGARLRGDDDQHLWKQMRTNALPGQTTAEGGLRWGFEFADGRRVTNVDGPGALGTPEQRNQAGWLPGPMLMSARGGGGHGHRADYGFWLWTLPPSGPLRVVAQWPDKDIAFTEQTIDADALQAAAGRARPLWPKPHLQT